MKTHRSSNCYWITGVYKINLYSEYLVLYPFRGPITRSGLAQLAGMSFRDRLHGARWPRSPGSVLLSDYMGDSRPAGWARFVSSRQIWRQSLNPWLKKLLWQLWTNVTPFSLIYFISVQFNGVIYIHALFCMHCVIGYWFSTLLNTPSCGEE